MSALSHQSPTPMPNRLVRWAAAPEPPTLVVGELRGRRWSANLYPNTITLAPVAPAELALAEALDALAAHDVTVGGRR